MKVLPEPEITRSNWGVDAYTIIPTDVESIDALIGGHYSPAVHGLLSPTGTGRSQIGYMLAAAGARRQLQIAKSIGDAAPWIVAVVQEQPAVVWASALAFLASVSLGDVEGCRFDVRGNRLKSIDFSLLAGNARLEESNDDDSPSGIERLEAAVPILTEMLQVIRLDATIYRDGFGPVDLLRSGLAERTHLSRPSVGGIVIDDVGLLVEQYRRACGSPTKALSSLISGFVSRCRSVLALPFDCPVWILHHLAGARAGRPIHKLSHKDAAETRHFGDHLDVCLVLGQKQPLTGWFSARCSKIPESAAHLAPRLLKFDGPEWRLSTVPKDMVRPRTQVFIDGHTREYLAELIEKKQHQDVDETYASATAVEHEARALTKDGAISHGRSSH
jgi:hypothetical protein